MHVDEKRLRGFERRTAGAIDLLERHNTVTSQVEFMIMIHDFCDVVPMVFLRWIGQ